MAKAVKQAKRGRKNGQNDMPYQSSLIFLGIIQDVAFSTHGKRQIETQALKIKGGGALPPKKNKKQEVERAIRTIRRILEHKY